MDVTQFRAFTAWRDALLYITGFFIVFFFSMNCSHLVVLPSLVGQSEIIYIVWYHSLVNKLAALLQSSILKKTVSIFEFLSFEASCWGDEVLLFILLPGSNTLIYEFFVGFFQWNFEHFFFWLVLSKHMKWSICMLVCWALIFYIVFGALCYFVYFLSIHFVLKVCSIGSMRFIDFLFCIPDPV